MTRQVPRPPPAPTATPTRDAGAPHHRSHRDGAGAISLEHHRSGDEPYVVWVSQDGRAGPDTPPLALCCPAAEVQRWLTEGIPEALLQRRLDGIVVLWDPVNAEVRRAGRALRDRLTPRTAGALAELAEQWPEAPLGPVLASMAPHMPVTFADLARALTLDQSPAAQHTARLAWALESL